MTTPAETLCLACGLCCNGTLHNFTYIRQGEAAHARALGLRVHQQRNGIPFFCQPCTAFQEPACSVYLKRPRACQQYTCRLLLGLTTGAVTLPNALQAAGQVRGLIAELRRLMSDPDPRLSLDQQVKSNWPACWRAGDPLPPEVQPIFAHLAAHLHARYGVRWLISKTRFQRWKKRLLLK